LKLSTNPLYTLLSGTEQLTVLAFSLNPDIQSDYSLIPVEQFIKLAKPDFYSAWAMRKVTALPLALCSGVIITTYHLVMCTFFKAWETISSAQLQDPIARHRFLLTQAQNEGYGRLISLVHDKRGLYWIYKSQFNRACLALHQTKTLPLELFHDQLEIETNPWDPTILNLFPDNEEGKARLKRLSPSTLKSLYPLFKPQQFFALLSSDHLNDIDYTLLSGDSRQVALEVMFSCPHSHKEIQTRFALLSPSNLRALQPHFSPIHYQLLPLNSAMNLDFSKLIKSQFAALTKDQKSAFIPRLDKATLEISLSLFEPQDFYYLSELQLQYLDLNRLSSEKISYALGFKIPKDIPSPSREFIQSRLDALPRKTSMNPILTSLRDHHDFDAHASSYLQSVVRYLICKGRITELPAYELRLFFITYGLIGRDEETVRSRISFIDQFLGISRLYLGESLNIGTRGTVVCTKQFSRPPPAFITHTLLPRLLKLDELEPLYPDLYKEILLRLVVFGYLSTQEEFALMLSLEPSHTERTRRYLPYALELATKNKSLELAITLAHWALLHPKDFGHLSLAPHLNYARFRALIHLGPKSTSSEKHPISEDSKERYSHLLPVDVIATPAWLSLSELRELLTETQKSDRWVQLLVVQRYLLDKISGTGIPLAPRPAALNTRSAPIPIPDSKKTPRHRLLCAAPTPVRAIDETAPASDSEVDSDEENYRRWGTPPPFLGFDKA